MKDCIINLASPQEIVKEVFHDNKEIINEFAKYFSVQILEFSEKYSIAYKKYLELNRLIEKTENQQVAHVTAFTYLLLDNLLVSLKLFVMGYTIPSGNLMRQVTESIALTTLCSLNRDITIYEKKKTKKINFYSLFISKSPKVKSHLAIKYLEWNTKELKINKKSIDALLFFKKLYNNYSHPSELGLATTISFFSQGKTFICGGFDAGKSEDYKKEFQFRIDFCAILPDIIEFLIQRVKELPNQALEMDWAKPCRF